mgnify:FL=1
MGKSISQNRIGGRLQKFLLCNPEDGEMRRMIFQTASGLAFGRAGIQGDYRSQQAVYVAEPIRLEIKRGRLKNVWGCPR